MGGTNLGDGAGHKRLFKLLQRSGPDRKAFLTPQPSAGVSYPADAEVELNPRHAKLLRFLIRARELDADLPARGAKGWRLRQEIAKHFHITVETVSHYVTELKKQLHFKGIDNVIEQQDGKGFRLFDGVEIEVIDPTARGDERKTDKDQGEDGPEEKEPDSQEGCS